VSQYVRFDYAIRRGKTGTLNILSKGKKLRLHHKDITSIDLSDIGRLDLHSIGLQNNRIEHVDFSDIASCKNLRSINLSNNNILDIDLEPLRNCEQLESIALDRNNLHSIDLSPLEGMRNLRSLSIGENNLQTIDLFPLAHCENLRTLNLLGNLLHKVNLAPILLCLNLQRVVLSGNPSFTGTIEMDEELPFSAVLIDALLQNAWKYGKPEWLARVGRVNHLQTPQVTEFVKRLDWKDIRDKIGIVLNRSINANWFESQKDILQMLEMSELVGLDATFRDILMKIPKLCDYEEGRNVLYENLIDMVRIQLENKGSTHFFDVESMSTTGSSILIPYILDRRKEEIEETILAIDDGTVHLEPLWKTGYGFEILSKLGMRRTTNRLGLGTLDEMFTSLGMKLKYRKVKHWPFGETTVQLSSRMERLLMSIAGLSKLEPQRI
jgi:hypothetical protein